MSARIISPLIAVTVGIVSGVYVFKPLIESYAESTKGTFRPEDDDKSAPIPPLPMTNLLPGKDSTGATLSEANYQAMIVDASGKKLEEGDDGSKITLSRS